MGYTNRTLTLQAEHLPFEFFRWQVREYEPDVACDVRSAGKGDRGITEPGDGNLPIRKIKSENPWSRETRVSIPTCEQIRNETYGLNRTSVNGPVYNIAYGNPISWR